MSATITVIDRATVARINEEHQAAQTAYDSALEHAVECGRLLAEVKGQLRHGEWLPWIEEHFEGSQRTAQVYMQLAASPQVDPQTSAHSSIAGALRQVSRPKPARPDRVAIDASLAAEFGDEPEPVSHARARETSTAVVPADGAAEARKVRRARELWAEIGEHLDELERDGMSRLARREEANAAGVTARRLIVALDDLTASYER